MYPTVTVTCAVRETEKKVYTTVTVTCAVRETEKSVYNFLQTYRRAQISHHYLALHNYNTQLSTDISLCSNKSSLFGITQLQHTTFYRLSLSACFRPFECIKVT